MELEAGEDGHDDHGDDDGIATVGDDRTLEVEPGTHQGPLRGPPAADGRCRGEEIEGLGQLLYSMVVLQFCRDQSGVSREVRSLFYTSSMPSPGQFKSSIVKDGSIVVGGGDEVGRIPQTKVEVRVGEQLGRRVATYKTEEKDNRTKGGSHPLSQGYIELQTRNLSGQKGSV